MRDITQYLEDKELILLMELFYGKRYSFESLLSFLKNLHPDLTFYEVSILVWVNLALKHPSSFFYLDIKACPLNWIPQLEKLGLNIRKKSGVVSIDIEPVQHIRFLPYLFLTKP